MASPKLFRLCRILLNGTATTIEPEGEVVFRARRGDTVELVLAYEYREPTHDKDETVLRFRAQLADKPLPAVEESFADRPLLADSRLNYLSIPVRAETAGRHVGRYLVEAEYLQEDWDRGDVLAERRHRHEGEFVLEVR